MNTISISIVLFIVGLCLGSYAGATVWRLRARSNDKVKDDPEDERETTKAFERIRKATIKDDRSLCLHCGHRLAWYDMIPLVSWVSLGRKCRYCRQPIGHMEPLIELGLGLFFVVSFVFWPYTLVTPLDVTIFTMWLVAGVGLSIIFVYDAKWFLVPDLTVYGVIVLGAISATLRTIQSDDPTGQLWSIAGAVLALAGLYYVLVVVSRETWVGKGDVQIGLGLALLLADWQLALLALFLANLIGTLIVLPGLIRRTLSRTSHVPFGPLLITGFVIAGLFGRGIIDWYMSTLTF